MKRGEALYVQGSAYFYGLARERIDHAKAHDLWAQAAAEGFGAAIGRCHFFGCGGFEKDELKAFRAWNEAAEECPYATFLLGFAYSSGCGVGKDEVKGLSMLRSAAKRGVGPAMNNCARALEHGKGTQKDSPGAWKLYRRAAEEHGVASAELRSGISPGR